MASDPGIQRRQRQIVNLQETQQRLRASATSQRPRPQLRRSHGSRAHAPYPAGRLPPPPASRDPAARLAHRGILRTSGAAAAQPLSRHRTYIPPPPSPPLAPLTPDAPVTALVPFIGGLHLLWTANARNIAIVPRNKTIAATRAADAAGVPAIAWTTPPQPPPGAVALPRRVVVDHVPYALHIARRVYTRRRHCRAYSNHACGYARAHPGQSCPFLHDVRRRRVCFRWLATNRLCALPPPASAAASAASSPAADASLPLPLPPPPPPPLPRPRLCRRVHFTTEATAPLCLHFQHGQCRYPSGAETVPSTVAATVTSAAAATAAVAQAAAAGTGPASLPAPAETRCRFLHVLRPADRPVCAPFVSRGFCEAGAVCPRRHVPRCVHERGKRVCQRPHCRMAHLRPHRSDAGSRAGARTEPGLGSPMGMPPPPPALTDAAARFAPSAGDLAAASANALGSPTPFDFDAASLDLEGFSAFSDPGEDEDDEDDDEDDDADADDNESDTRVPKEEQPDAARDDDWSMRDQDDTAMPEAAFTHPFIKREPHGAPDEMPAVVPWEWDGMLDISSESD